MVETRSIFRIVGPDRQTLGTAFKVAPFRLLSCHHVATAASETYALNSNGDAFSIRKVHAGQLAEFDLAILELQDDPGDAIPVYSGTADIGAFRTLGFQFGQKGVQAAFPSEGNVRGRTDIEYRANRSYELRHVYVLSDTDLDEGVSGAPLIDKLTGVAVGVAVGVVIARMFSHASTTGYAIPLEQAAHNQKMAGVISNNDRITPRFGCFMNRLGFESLVEDHLSEAIKRLEAEELFDRQKFIARADLNHELDSFKDGNTRFCPIVGPSGNGKTNQLASWALEHKLLLLRFVDVSSTDRHIGDTVLTALNRAAEVKKRSLISDAVVLTALLAEMPTPLLIVDGLNEIQAHLSGNFVSWWTESCYWLRNTNIRLALSSRPETWELARENVPDTWISKLPAGDEESVGAIGVTDFTFDEALEFCHEHDLDVSLVIDRHAVNPFLLRLAADVGASRNMDFQTLVRAWIEKKCVSAALFLGGKATKASLMHFLKRVAATMWTATRSWISRSEYFAIFYGDIAVGEALITHNVFSESQEGLRFSFDGAAEWLASTSVTTADLREEGFWQRRNWDPIILGAVREHILALCNDDSLQEANTLVRQAADAAQKHSELQYMLVQIFVGHPQPDTIFEYIERIARLYVDEFFGSRELKPLFTNSRLSLERRMALAQIIARKESSYEWEVSKWPRLQEYVFRKGYGVGALRPLIEEEPSKVFRILSHWFSDRTPLGSGHSTVANVAGGLIYYFAHLDIPGAFHVVFGDARSIAESTLREIVNKYPSQIVRILSALVPGATPEIELNVLNLIAQILQSKCDVATRKGAARIAKRIYDAPKLEESRDAALECLLYAPHRLRQHEDHALRLFRDNPDRISEHVIVLMSRKRFKDILEAFHVAILANLQRLKRVQALGYVDGPQKYRIAVVELLLRLAPHAEDGYPLTATLETLFYRLKPRETMLRAKLFTAAKDLFNRYRGTARVPLIYYVSGVGKSRDLASSLFPYFLRRGLDLNEIKLLLERSETWPSAARQRLINYAIRHAELSENPKQEESVILYSLHWGFTSQALDHLFQTLKKKKISGDCSPFARFVSLASRRGIKAAEKAILKKILK